MSPPATYENQYLILPLGGSDVDSDTFNYFIENGLNDVSGYGNNAGKIYQYMNNFDPSSATEITGTNVQVTDVYNRIIYMPPRFGSSFADPTVNPQFLIIPCFAYHVKENATAELFQSNSLQVQIEVLPVNQPPFVYGDMAFYEEAALGRSWAPVLDGGKPACLAGLDASNNTLSCTFKEDLGEEFWWNTGYVHIYLGGDDVERSKLTYQLTHVDCPSGAIFQATLDLTRNLQVGDTWVNRDAGSAQPLIRFQPAKETWDGFFNQTYYCQMRYVVIDAQGATSREGGVTLHVTYVAKPPRLTSSLGGNNLNVVARELVPQQFQIPASSPSSTSFDTVITSCEKTWGTYVFCSVADCTTNVTLDCANIPSGGFIAPPMQPAITGFFTSGPLANGGQGVRYNRFTLHFDDHSGNFVPHDFYVQFDVIKINQAPVILVDGAQASTHTATAKLGDSILPNWNVSDPDSGSGFVTLTMTLVLPSANSSITFDMSGLAHLTAAQGSAVTLTNGTQLVIRGPMHQVETILSSVAIASPSDKDLNMTASLIVLLSDNGYNGQCPDEDSPSPRLCPLTDTTTISLEWAKSDDNDKVVIASSASAAGVAGIAAIGLIAAFKRMNRKAQEQSYSPWEDENGLDDVVSNPLYEQSAHQGVNPLFEAGH